VVDGYDQDEILLEKGGSARTVASRRRKVEHGEVDLSRCELDVELGACQFDEYQVKVGVSLGDRALATAEASHGRVVPMIPYPYGSGDFAGEGEHVREQRVELDLNSPRAGNESAPASVNWSCGNDRPARKPSSRSSFFNVRRRCSTGPVWSASAGRRERTMIGDPDDCAQLA